MIEIELTRGKVALVDEADSALVLGSSWRAWRGRGAGWYAYATIHVDGKRKDVKMHRTILGLKLGDPEVDHVNGDGLDNRRANLRIATSSQNHMNSDGCQARRKSKYKGVSWTTHRDMIAGGLWCAKIAVNGKRIRRYAHSELEAARLYNDLALQHFGEFARLNAVC